MKDNEYINKSSSSTSSKLFIVATIMLLLDPVQSFQVQTPWTQQQQQREISLNLSFPNPSLSATSRRRISKQSLDSYHPLRSAMSKHVKSSSSSSTTQLKMYNLPPPGGNRNNGGLGDILKGIGGLALTVAFFASPLGGLVLGVFNSILVLSLLLPVIGTVGFQAWQYFFTINGNCPSCSAPIRVMKTNKDGEATPTVCYSCGSILQAKYDNSGIDNVTGRNSIYDDNQVSSIFDLFGGNFPSSSSSSSSSFSTSSSSGPQGYSSSRREQRTTVIYEDDEGFPTSFTNVNKKTNQNSGKNTKSGMDIIDAEIEDDEPFQ